MFEKEKNFLDEGSFVKNEFVADVVIYKFAVLAQSGRYSIIVDKRGNGEFEIWADDFTLLSTARATAAALNAAQIRD